MISGFRREIDEICSLFWEITQRVVVSLYRRFGTNYRSHLQGSRIGTKDSLPFEDGTERLSRNVSKNYLYTLHNVPEERRSHPATCLLYYTYYLLYCTGVLISP